MKARLIVELVNRAGNWHWRARAPNGHVLAIGARMYRRRWDAARGAQRLLTQYSEMEVRDESVE